MAKKLARIEVQSTRRSEVMPEVPNLAEAGFPNGFTAEFSVLKDFPYPDIAQHIQQILSALNVQSQVLRRYHELHLKGLFDENEGIVDRPALYVNTANNISYISFMNKATP